MGTWCFLLCCLRDLHYQKEVASTASVDSCVGCSLHKGGTTTGCHPAAVPLTQRWRVSMQRKERLFLIYSKVPVGFLVLLGKVPRLSLP